MADFSNCFEYPDGFYWLTTDHNEECCLVKLYTPIEPRVRGIGFGAWDGGSFMPLSEVVHDAHLTAVSITPR